jgi:uncharacterized membrane protein
MKLTVRKMAVAGVLGAVSLVMGFVPWLGLIPVPTPAQHATILHVPAILAGMAEGPVVGLVVGLIFGIISLTRATIPAFADPLVAVLPRLFIGVLAAYTFAGVRRFGLQPALIAAGVVGTLTNTVLVLSMMVLRGYLPASAALGVGLLHGLPEVVVAALICSAVGTALSRAGLIDRAVVARSSAASAPLH